MGVPGGGGRRFLAYNAGLTVTEVPITFVDRMNGESKMSGAIVAEAGWRVTQWGLEHRLARLPGVPRAGAHRRPDVRP